jgi:hypothetical protein
MSDALERVRMKGDPTLNAIVDELIGCAWGRKVTTPDDPWPCPNQARTVVVVHDGEDQRELKLSESFAGCPCNRSSPCVEVASALRCCSRLS